MKKSYETPEVDVVTFLSEDIITTSDTYVGDAKYNIISGQFWADEVDALGK